MKLIKFILFLFVSQIILEAQKYDYNWHLGYRTNDSMNLPHRGITNFNFNSSSLNPVIRYDSFKIIDFDWTCNDMSDENGNYLFSYNGFTIENYLNKIIRNGQGGFSEQQFYGDVSYQAGCILPTFKKNKFLLIHDFQYLDFNWKTYFSNGMRNSVIDMNANNNMGSVVLKNSLILSDTLDPGRILAIKHANGQDWWVIRGRFDMKSFYKFLITNETIKLYDHQFIGEEQNVPLGGVTVSPEGNRIVYFHQHIAPLNGLPGENGFFINMFDFDRTTGLLSNPKVLKISSDTSYLYGASFSPNSKFLYISRVKYLYQIDMTKQNLVLDTVAIYDGFNYVSPTNFRLFTWFGFLERAPDGRIYGNTNCCTQQYMYYINRPNLKGKACDVRQHSIKITAHNNLPSFPNYRLGPIDGSIADTLGIDNIPVAEFRYDQDTLKYRKIEFTNLSWYDPDEWWWDWGDGSPVYYTTVWDTAITHEYAKDRVYNVCLRAKNKNGENTICKKLQIGTTSVNQLDTSTIDISLSPNPCNELFIVQLNNYLPERMELSLLNLEGKIIAQKRLYEGSNLIDTELYPSGVYIIEVTERRKKVFSSKLFINH